MSLHWGGRGPGHCPRKVTAGSAAAATIITTLNSSKKGPTMVLSNGNLTVVHAPGGSWETVLATESKSTANSTGYYFEATATTVASFARAGFAVTTIDVTGTQYIGMDANSQGVASDGGTFTSGSLLGFYLKNSKFWWSLAGAWQNGNPVSGTGGTAVTIGATVFPAFSALPSNGQWDVNFGATAFAGSIPSGGVSWNTV